LSFWHECLWEAVELVDWRCGEIRTRAINQWLADESLKGIQQLAHPRIQKLAERLEDQLPEMLTSWMASLSLWPIGKRRRNSIFQDHAAAACFRDSVARFWRLEHAVRHNGHAEFRKAALEAQQWLALWIEGDPSVQGLAEQLLTLLERTVRTSSAAEAINSVLRPYLVRRRECTDLINRQLFLNLFVFVVQYAQIRARASQRQSPYEIAGIDLGTDDWLTLLGYPPDVC